MWAISRPTLRARSIPFIRWACARHLTRAGLTIEHPTTQLLVSQSGGVAGAAGGSARQEVCSGFAAVPGSIVEVVVEPGTPSWCKHSPTCHRC